MRGGPGTLERRAGDCIGEFWTFGVSGASIFGNVLENLDILGLRNDIFWNVLEKLDILEKNNQFSKSRKNLEKHGPRRPSTKVAPEGGSAALFGAREGRPQNLGHFGGLKSVIFCECTEEFVHFGSQRCHFFGMYWRIWTFWGSEVSFFGMYWRIWTFLGSKPCETRSWCGSATAPQERVQMVATLARSMWDEVTEVSCH